MTYPIPNYTRVWVRGRIIDLGKAALQEDNYGLALPVTFSPSPKVLLNAGTGQIISTASFKITPAAQDGYFAIQLPATDDPDINPTNFTYSVKEPTGRSYNIVVPAATPPLNSPGDPLHGQPVLDLITIVPSPPAGAGSVQLLTGTPGRGIASVDNVAGDLVVTYTDSTTQNLGPVTGGVSDQDLADAVAPKANLTDLADVATSGAYADLSGLPTIPTSPGDIGAQPAGSYATTSAVDLTAIVVTPGRFAVDPTGTGDSTLGLQAAVDYALGNNLGCVFIPAGTYKVSGTINVPQNLELRGVFSPVTSTSGQYVPVGCTVLVATAGTPGAPVISFNRASGDAHGCRLADIFILGSANWNSTSGAVDRIAVAAYRVHTEVSFERVMISGFLRQGFYFEEVYDGTFIGCRVMWTGTDNVYPAIEYTGVTQNSNAIHAFGLHVENCAFHLKISGASRHNQFVACKFEMNGAVGASPPIQILNSYETTFIGCQFVARNCDDTAFFADNTLQPHMISVNSATATVSFSGGCSFSTAPYNGGSSTLYGSRWLRVIAGRVSVSSSMFDACWTGPGLRSVILGSEGLFTGNVVWSRALAGQRQLLEMTADCVVSGNLIQGRDGATPSSGALFTVTGAGNVFALNKIKATFFEILNGPPTQNVQEVAKATVTLPDLATVPNVGWVHPSATKLFKVSNSVATSVTSLAGAQSGDSIELLFTNSTTTLVHSANFRLRGAVNVTPGFANIIRFYYDGSVWFEAGRNF